MMNKEQMERVLEVVRVNPGISMLGLDAKFDGMILGIGDVSGISEEAFDDQMVGDQKPLKKVDGGYFVNM